MFGLIILQIKLESPLILSILAYVFFSLQLYLDDIDETLKIGF